VAQAESVSLPRLDDQFTLELLRSSATRGRWLVTYAASLIAPFFAPFSAVVAPVLSVVAPFFSPVLAVFTPLFAAFHPRGLSLGL